MAAERLECNRSATFREHWRNHVTDAEVSKTLGYFSIDGSMKVLLKRKNGRKRIRHAVLRELIIERSKTVGHRGRLRGV